MSEHILLVSNNEFDTKLMEIILMQADCKVTTVQNGLHVLEQVKKEQPNLIIIDTLIPGMNGINVYHDLQNQGIFIPTIMLINKEDNLNKISSLVFINQTVANHTFSVIDLALQVRSILQRTSQTTIITRQKDRFQYGELLIDLGSREVFVRNKKVDFTLKEFNLLCFLVQNPGRVFNREVIFKMVWGREHRPDTRVLDVHVAHVRDKIEVDPKKPEYIQTVRKIGYKMALHEFI